MPRVPLYVPFWRGLATGNPLAPPLTEVETDKATLSWENQDDGYVARLLVPAGAKDIPIGEPVAILVDDASDIDAFKDYEVLAGANEPAAQPVASSSKKEVPAAMRISPAARILLEHAGIEASTVEPTGPRGTLTKQDALAAIASGPGKGNSSSAAPKPKPAAPQPAQHAAAKPQVAAPAAAQVTPQQGSDAPFVDIPTSQIRRIIAKRLLESKQTIPHLYLSASVDIDSIVELRTALKAQGAKVSVNDCVIKAVALSLAEVPAANSMWDAVAEEIKILLSVDISIAVATETGLITPIVKGADKKSLSQISAEVRELAAKAKANKLKPEEFLGGTFSISNLGMFGIDHFSAIINPPQACIMAVGGARQVCRMVDGNLAAKTEMTVTLSADHRVYDGEVAANLLKAFEKNMKNPYLLMA
jgi:pyruvate dehydrogenase E2 component (dihydrolipoamide acetyltransferase)